MFQPIGLIVKPPHLAAYFTNARMTNIVRWCSRHGQNEFVIRDRISSDLKSDRSVSRRESE
jgi:hypothetical protein